MERETENQTIVCKVLALLWTLELIPLTIRYEKPAEWINTIERVASIKACPPAIGSLRPYSLWVEFFRSTERRYELQNTNRAVIRRDVNEKLAEFIECNYKGFVLLQTSWMASHLSDVGNRIVLHDNVTEFEQNQFIIVCTVGGRANRMWLLGLLLRSDAPVVKAAAVSACI